MYSSIWEAQPRVQSEGLKVYSVYLPPQGRHGYASHRLKGTNLADSRGSTNACGKHESVLPS